MAEQQHYVPTSAMVVVAHPDDAEFMVSGTIAKWARQGADITYVLTTKGDKGSDDPEMTPQHLADVRRAEQEAAAAILGVNRCVFLGYEDGYLQHTLALRRDITRVIRQYRPEVVVTFDPTTRFIGQRFPNHPDHRTTGDATVDAVFPSARDRLTFPELLTENLAPHKTAQLWLTSSDQPNVWVDIGEDLETKRRAVLAHTSQMTEQAVPFLEEMARWTAQNRTMEYAEAFRRIIFDVPGGQRWQPQQEAEL